jgi:DNA repair protein RadC
MFRVNRLEKVPGERVAGEIQPIPENSSPAADLRRRLERFGAGCLADEELLTLLLGPGGGVTPWELASRICRRWPDLSRLAVIPALVLARQAGISPARARRLLAAIELGLRSNSPVPATEIVVQRPEDIHPLLHREFQGLDRERFLTLYLDTRHRVRGIETVSIGTLNASLVHPREVFKNAIGMSAAAVIVAHNHPSGCPRPSSDDLDLTARLDRCGEILGIPLLDHLVAGDAEIISIRECGWPA